MAVLGQWFSKRVFAVLVLLAICSAPLGTPFHGDEANEQAKQVDLLALAVWHEARGEPQEAKALVASTILERVRDQRWPDTIEGVLTQGSQFFGLDLSTHPSPNAPGWQDCVDAVLAALHSGSTATANHFHAANVTPDWHDPKKVVKRLGGHVFLRL